MHFPAAVLKQANLVKAGTQKAIPFPANKLQNSSPICSIMRFTRRTVRGNRLHVDYKITFIQPERRQGAFDTLRILVNVAL